MYIQESFVLEKGAKITQIFQWYIQVFMIWSVKLTKNRNNLPSISMKKLELYSQEINNSQLWIQDSNQVKDITVISPPEEIAFIIASEKGNAIS